MANVYPRIAEPVVATLRRISACLLAIGITTLKPVKVEISQIGLRVLAQLTVAVLVLAEGNIADQLTPFDSLWCSRWGRSASVTCA